MKRLYQFFKQDNVTLQEAKAAAAVGYKEQQAYLKDLKRHAGIEYFIDALFLYEMGHAAMHHFGGIAYCIGRDCRLPFLPQSSLLNQEELENFTYETTQRVCQLCGNHCKLTVNSFQRITLYSAFFTTLMDRPAEISSISAPSLPAMEKNW